jgi:hypothetical protein
MAHSGTKVSVQLIVLTQLSFLVNWIHRPRVRRKEKQKDKSEGDNKSLHRETPFVGKSRWRGFYTDQNRDKLGLKMGTRHIAILLIQETTGTVFLSIF